MLTFLISKKQKDNSEVSLYIDWADQKFFLKDQEMVFRLTVTEPNPDCIILESENKLSITLKRFTDGYMVKGIPSMPILPLSEAILVGFIEWKKEVIKEFLSKITLEEVLK